MGKQPQILFASALVLGLTLIGCGKQECSVIVRGTAEALIDFDAIAGALAKSTPAQGETCPGGSDLPATEEACYYVNYGSIIDVNVSINPSNKTISAELALMGSGLLKCTEATYTIAANGDVTAEWAAACNQDPVETSVSDVTYCGSAADSINLTMNAKSINMNDVVVIASRTPCESTVEEPQIKTAKCTFLASEECCNAAKANMPYDNGIHLESELCDQWDVYYADHGAWCEDRTNTCNNPEDMAQFEETCREDLDGIKLGNCVNGLGSPDNECMVKYFGKKYSMSCTLSLADLMTCAVQAGKDNCINKCISDQDSDDCRKCGEKAMIDNCLDMFEAESGIPHCPFVFAPETLYDFSIPTVRVQSSFLIPGALGAILLGALIAGAALRRARHAAPMIPHVELLSQQATD